MKKCVNNTFQEQLYFFTDDGLEAILPSISFTYLPVDKIFGKYIFCLYSFLLEFLELNLKVGILHTDQNILFIFLLKNQGFSIRR